MFRFMNTMTMADSGTSAQATSAQVTSGEIKKRRMSSRGSLRPWDPVLFHPVFSTHRTSYIALRTVFIVGIDTNLNIPLSLYLWSQNTSVLIHY